MGINVPLYCGELLGGLIPPGNGKFLGILTFLWKGMPPKKLLPLRKGKPPKTLLPPGKGKLPETLFPPRRGSPLGTLLALERGRPLLGRITLIG